MLQPAQQLQQQQQLSLLVPGQTTLTAQQLVAANQMSPGQATVPAQQVMFTQALPQTVPMLLSLPAAMTQPVQLVPGQGVMQAPPVPGLTPLEHVPTQVGIICCSSSPSGECVSEAWNPDLTPVPRALCSAGC